MDQFYPLNYVGHGLSQSIPQESKLATYAALRNTSSGNGDASHHLTQSLASLSLDGAGTANSVGAMGGLDGGMYQNGGTYCHGGEDSMAALLGNGTPPLAVSRDPTPIPPMTYQNNYDLRQPQIWVEQAAEDSRGWNVGGTVYYFTEDTPAPPQLLTEDISAPLLYPSYSVYSGPPSHLKDYSPRLGTLPPANANPTVQPVQSQTSYFVADDIRQEITHKNTLSLAQPCRQNLPDLPLQVEHFTDICPMEANNQQSVTFGYPTTVYKATNMKTGFSYCLRRIQGFRIPSSKCIGLIDAWKQIVHTNLVSLREVFTTKAFGDSSLIFVYDYFPAAETFMTRYFDRNSQANGYVDPFNTGDPTVPRPYSHQKNALLKHHANMLPENLIWAYVVQLSSIIRTIHSAGLSVRSLDPSKILAVSKTRPTIRLNCCGVYDIVGFDPSANHQVSATQFYQFDDLLSLGKLILALACNSLLAIQHDNLVTSMDLISRTYSSDLRNLIMYLMNPRPTGTRTINDIMPMIGARFYNQLDAAVARADVLEDDLAKELENGRLFRLIVKLNTVLEREELALDSAWAETGNRYLLKLFRDFVFHPVTSDGRPFVDMSHVIHCLNRLDSGISEKVYLSSRDSQSVLITTFAELRVCLEQSFNDVLSIANPSPINTGQHQHSRSGLMPSTQ